MNFELSSLRYAYTKPPVVLVTGATGFLGGAVVARLLEQLPDDSRLVLLVRANDENDGWKRLENSISRFGVSLTQCNGDRVSITVIVADLATPSSIENAQLDDVTHVLHIAANTSFISSASIRQINVDGTLALAKRLLKCEHITRFFYVSTAMACGIRPSGMVYEKDSFYNSHVVQYTESKAEAEAALTALKPQLPLIIVRPSIIVGHTSLGCSPSGSIFWVFRAIDALRRTNWPLSNRIDVIPVDWAALALGHLLLSPLRYDTYHISAGSSSNSWYEIADAFAEANGEPIGKHRYTRVNNDIRTWDKDQVISMLGHGARKSIVSALHTYFQFTNSIVFNNQRLMDEGIPSSPKFSSYIKRCLDTSKGRHISEQMIDDGNQRRNIKPILNSNSYEVL